MKKLTYKFKLYNKKIKDDDVLAWASMLTLFLMLALFPIIILVTDLVTRISINDPMITEYLIKMLPMPVFETIKAIAEDIEVNQSASVIPTAIIVALWSASRGILAIIHALNKAYGIKETRSYIKLRGLALLYTLGFIMLILINLLLVVFGNSIYDTISKSINISATLNPFFDILRIGVTFMFSLIFFMFLYNLPPTIKVGFKKVLPGAILSSIGLISSSSVFSIYVKYSTSLTYLYGSLTGFMLLIIWLFILSYLIMIGGEVNAIYARSLSDH